MLNERKVGRPPKRNKVAKLLTIRFQVGDYERLKRLAVEKRIPVATVVRNLVLDQLVAQ